MHLASFMSRSHLYISIMDKIVETWNWILQKTTLDKPNRRQMLVHSVLFVVSAVVMGTYGMHLECFYDL